jgi:DNA-binding LytR/AlgR family response regulator
MQKLITIVRRKKLPASEIILLKSDVNYTHLFLKDGKQITVAKTLKEMEPRFVQEGFLRTHKSYLINPNFITGYCPAESKIQLHYKFDAVVSRRKKVAFENVIY